MTKLNTPFRYDYVGSFLRPEELKQARTDFENGKITADELKAVEDKAITDLVEKQKRPVITLLLTVNSVELLGI